MNLPRFETCVQLFRFCNVNQQWYYIDMWSNTTIKIKSTTLWTERFLERGVPVEYRVNYVRIFQLRSNCSYLYLKYINWNTHSTDLIVRKNVVKKTYKIHLKFSEVYLCLRIIFYKVASVKQIFWLERIPSWNSINYVRLTHGIISIGTNLHIMGLD